MAYTLQDSYTTNNNQGAMADTAWMAQLFTAGSSYTVTQISVNLYKAAGATGTLTVSLRATSGGKPTGADLASDTMSVADLPTSNDGTVFQDFEFSPGYALTNGTVYAIVVRTSGATTVYWKEQTSGDYAGGTRCSSIDSGATWSVNSTIDYDFKTYSGGAAVNATVSPDALSLTLTAQAPSVAYDCAIAVGAALGLVLTIPSPTAAGIITVTVYPAPLALTLTVLTPKFRALTLMASPRLVACGNNEVWVEDT
jgi:hypothetical protein